MLQMLALILVATGARLRVAPAILDGILTDTDATLDLVTRYAWGSGAPPRRASPQQEPAAQIPRPSTSSGRP